MDTCQELYQKLNEWKIALDELNNLILEYTKNPSEALETQIEAKKEEIEQKKKEYILLFENSFIETEFTDLYGHRRKEKIFKEESKALENIKKIIKKEPKIKVENGHIITFSVSSYDLPHDILYPALKDNIKYFTKLDELDCSLNKLTSLPELPDSLTILRCAYNQLTSLPELSDGLTFFDCFGNQLTSLPELPDGLDKIICSNNQLSSLPELPKSLTLLYCDNNKLTSLPELPKSLVYLYCYNNQLTSLHELPDGLTYLDCSNNPLTEESKRKIEEFKKNHPHCKIYY